LKAVASHPRRADWAAGDGLKEAIGGIGLA
jgi:hypothetical protein